MQRPPHILTSLLIGLSLAGCRLYRDRPQGDGGGVDEAALQHQREHSELIQHNDLDRVEYLSQGWDREMREQWNTTSQGSRLIPLRWFLALRRHPGQPGYDAEEDSFHSQQTWLRYRFLPQEPTEANPHGLPVGVAVDLHDVQLEREPQTHHDPTGLTRNEPYIGFTCATCHTGQINTVTEDGTAVGLRIDGAPTMADLEGWLLAVQHAMRATLPENNPEAWLQFMADVEGPDCDVACENALEEGFREVLRQRTEFEAVTANQVKGGFGRLDALTGILNLVSSYYLPVPENRVLPEQPASISHIWSSPYYDFVEWNGVNSNNGLGPLARNVGEVLGTYATVEHRTREHMPRAPFVSFETSIRWTGVRELEHWSHFIQPPAWPEAYFGAIDHTKASRGEELYRDHCLRCHVLVDGETHEQIEPPLEEQRRLRGLTIQSVMVHPDEVGTDPTYAGSIIGRMVDTGPLEGEKPQGIPGLAEFGPEATAVQVLRHFVASSISHHLGVALEQFLEALVDHRGTLAAVPERHFEGPRPEDELYAYRARDLNGIWATAPYLHNGSVLTLWDLLSPPEERPTVIHTGTFSYDHENMGYENTNVCPTAWNEPGSAWTWPETDFGTPDRYELARARWPDLTICQAQGYQLIVDPARPEWVGNHNSGHRYGTDLPEADRRALLEYLKTL